MPEFLHKNKLSEPIILFGALRFARYAGQVLFSFGEKRKKNPTQEKRNPQVKELCATLEFNDGALHRTSQRLVIAALPPKIVIVLV